MADQLTIEGDFESIPGVMRDPSGKLAQRWVQIVRTSEGLVVHAPPDVSAHVSTAGQVILEWPE